MGILSPTGVWTIQRTTAIGMVKDPFNKYESDVCIFTKIHSRFLPNWIAHSQKRRLMSGEFLLSYSFSFPMSQPKKQNFSLVVDLIESICSLFDRHPSVLFVLVWLSPKCPYSLMLCLLESNVGNTNCSLSSMWHCPLTGDIYQRNFAFLLNDTRHCH